VQDFWKNYNLCHAVRNIAKAWEELFQNCCTSVWGKICAQFVHPFRGFQKDLTYKEVAKKIVKLANQLVLEVGICDGRG
jgi:hypothetical protein